MLLPAFVEAEDPKLVADTPPRSAEEQLKLFHLPPGFEIQLFASEPDIIKPINIAFDDRCRLWATQSVEYPFPAPPDKTPRDCVKIMEDTDGDGRADRTTTFVDGLNIPIGVIPIRGGGIVYSIPYVYRFLDSDGDGRADTREVLYREFGHRDTHGMASSFTVGLDGWIYACHGFSNESEVKGSDGKAVRMQSGNTYRFRPDGSHIEQFTWGQVNPFGLCFDPLMNLYSADCHSRPIYALLRGAYYPSFGKPHDGLGFAPEICPHEHGSTAISGIVYYAADQFPPEFRDTIFTGNPVTNRIDHDRLDRHGSTLMAVHQPDFLSCDDPWFRPVSLTQGPDGALYVADFYNRIIGHYEVPLTHPGRDHERGRIWRIVYTGKDGQGKATPPRKDWTTASVADLVQDLDHANFVVRTQATNQLVERIGQPAAQAVETIVRPTARQRTHALWVQERLGSLGDDTLRNAMLDPDAGVRTHAMKVLGDHAALSSNERGWAVQALSDKDAFVQRAAAEVLGRHPSPDNVLPLLGLRRTVPAEDTHLMHAVRMALRDQLRLDETLESLTSTPLDEAGARDLADVAVGVPSAGTAAMLLKHLQTRELELANRARFLGHVVRHLADDRLPELYATAERLAGEDLRGQAAVLQVLNEGMQSRGGMLPEQIRDWAVDVAGKLIATKQPQAAGDGIALARGMKLEPLVEPLTRVAAGELGLGGQRADAVSALVAIEPAKHVSLLSKLLGEASEPMPLRQHIANSLGQIQQPPALEALVTQLRTSPEELAVHIAAALATSRAGAEQLLAEVAAGKASARLLQNPLVNGKLGATRLPDLAARLAKLTEGLPPAEARLLDLIRVRRAGYSKAKSDAERGAKVFEKQCGICHTIAGRGAKVGPQLDGIGARGLDRILEDVLDPNRNIDQAFRSTIIALKNGQVLTGLALSSDGEVVVLADAQGKEIRVPKSDIDQQSISKLSAMPANVADLVPEPDFYDLVSYLLDNRVPRAVDVKAQ